MPRTARKTLFCPPGRFPVMFDQMIDPILAIVINNVIKTRLPVTTDPFLRGLKLHWYGSVVVHGKWGFHVHYPISMVIRTRYPTLKDGNQLKGIGDYHDPSFSPMKVSSKYEEFQTLMTTLDAKELLEDMQRCATAGSMYPLCKVYKPYIQTTNPLFIRSWWRESSCS